MKQHENYNTYSNILKTYNEYISFADLHPEQVKILVDDLVKYGVEEILFDCDDYDDDDIYSDTMFIKTTAKTDYKSLMKTIVALRPHEFSEETPNHFRLWFD